ncbi:MAG: hypothetical protein Q8S19_10060, partial [Bacillota bacterium]|nr:hypothetical protein [Bacillota bacterium]
MVKTENELILYLNEIEGRLEKIGQESGALSFDRFVDKQPKPRLIELEKERSAIVLDPVLHEVINTWALRISDPLLARRLELWQNTLLASKVAARPDVLKL